jgi:hypothetical protein
MYYVTREVNSVCVVLMLARVKNELAHDEDASSYLSCQRPSHIKTKSSINGVNRRACLFA